MIQPLRHPTFQRAASGLVVTCALTTLTSCKSPGDHRRDADKAAYGIIAEKQLEATGETEPFTIQTAADRLRNRLLLEQGLPVAGAASLGTSFLSPIPHWPNDNYLQLGGVFPPEEPIVLVPERAPLRLSLLEALQVGARNSREYQQAKEEVFLTALDLDLERNFFNTSWFGTLGGSASSDLGGDDDVSGVTGFGDASLLKRFHNGATLTGRIGIDIVKLLTQSENSSVGVFGDASISIPLLRGSGAHIFAEPLLQAERNAVYAIWEFERFKAEFAVEVAERYLGVLEVLDRVKNTEENYRSLILSVRRARALANAGQLPEIDVDQALQRELTARTRWIAARQQYAAALDSFKVFLGLPADARIELDRGELARLRAEVETRLDHLATAAQAALRTGVEVESADAPIILRDPNPAEAGPYELPEEQAIRIALHNRRDLQVVMGRVYDAQRAVVVAADALGAELTLFGSVATGERRTLSSANLDDSYSLPLDRAVYDALLTLDLPLERTEERDAYRASLVALERAVRDLQAFEDDVKFDVRSALRDLVQAREALTIESQAVALAQRRVESTDLFLQAGRAEIRDVLEAQEDLVDAQNALTSALVEYRILELQLQRDMGVLNVDENGLWQEFVPTGEELNDVES